MKGSYLIVMHAFSPSVAVQEAATKEKAGGADI